VTGPAQTRAWRMHADEVRVDDHLVRRLLAAQFPDWSGLPIQRVASTGTDNAIYRLGDAYGVRLPRIGWAVGQVTKEAEWIPRLGGHLPATLPEPLAVGEAACGYPYPWLVYRWIEGIDALSVPVADWADLVGPVAAFVIALQAVDTTGAPPAGTRAGPLASVDSPTRAAIEHLAATIDVARARAVWEEALAADPWAGPGVWVHGDLLPGNVLLRSGSLAGIIDWSAAGVGDPACEAMLGWAMPAPARAAYRKALRFDDATWARGRGWALQQAVFFVPYYEMTIPTAVAAARRRLEAILADSLAGGGRG
jgi:aminoglycoside phosphotransferase (APT) family kinase protein